MSRSNRGFFVLVAALFFLGAVGAQQPNSASGTLTINFQNHATGSTGPINVNLTTGGAVVVTVRGQPLQRFLLAASTVLSPGVSLAPYGILDIFFPFSVLLDGFNPQNPLSYFAVTNPTGSFEFVAALSTVNPYANFAIQGAVADPALPGGGVLTAATNLTVAPFTTSTVTIPDSQLGDDVTVIYYHQALSFPFYGMNYGRTNIDTNGYLSFGPSVASQYVATTANFLAGVPRIAPYWSDLHMSSTAQSAGGILSQAPASIIITETLAGPGQASLQIDWRYATEAFIAGAPAATPGNRFDLRCTLNASGLINFAYGPNIAPGLVIPPNGNVLALCGITTGGNLSPVTASRNLVQATAVVPYTATSPDEAIFESFPISAGTFIIDLVGPTAGISFQPTSLTSPGNRFYQLF